MPLQTQLMGYSIRAIWAQGKAAASRFPLQERGNIFAFYIQ
jgi:hypothetical protein